MHMHMPSPIPSTPASLSQPVAPHMHEMHTSQLRCSAPRTHAHALSRLQHACASLSRASRSRAQQCCSRIQARDATRPEAPSSGLALATGACALLLAACSDPAYADTPLAPQEIRGSFIAAPARSAGLFQDDVEYQYRPAPDPVASALLEIVSIADSLSLATSDFLQTQEDTGSQAVAADAAAQMSQRALAVAAQAMALASLDIPEAERLLLRQITESAHAVSAMASDISQEQARMAAGAGEL